MLGTKLIRSICAVAAAAILGCSEGTDPRFDEVFQVTVFSSTGYFVAVGRTLQLEGRAITWEGNRVDERVTAWASSNSSIATVSNTGLVTGKAVGSTNITATAEGVTSAPRLINVTPDDGVVQ